MESEQAGSNGLNCYSYHVVSFVCARVFVGAFVIACVRRVCVCVVAQIFAAASPVIPSGDRDSSTDVRETGCSVPTSHCGYSVA
jgi:hypothetical protein